MTDNQTVIALFRSKVSTGAVVAASLVVAAAVGTLAVSAPDASSTPVATAPVQMSTASVPNATPPGRATATERAADKAALPVFTAQLRTADFSAKEAAGYAGAGKRICADLRSGAATPGDVAFDLTDNVGFTSRKADTLIHASVVAYCPQQKQLLPKS